MSYEIPEGFGEMRVTVGNDATGHLDSVSFGLDLTDATGLTQAQFNTLSNTVRDSLKVLWDSGWRVGPVRMLYRNAAGLVTIEDTAQEAGTAAAADYAPPAVAVVVRKKTPFAGKANRGRMYLPGALESEIDENGELSSSYLGDVQTAVTAFLAALIADPSVDNLALLHGEGSSVPPRTITSLVVAPAVGTMRPRQRRVA